MSQTKWQFLHFTQAGGDNQTIKPHIAPASLVRPLLRDLAGRDGAWNVDHSSGAITKTGMDQPGMCRTDRPWEDLKFAGLTFSVPSEDLLSFYQRCLSLPPRQFANGQPYYKLHSWLNCIVLKPVHKISLELQMQERLPMAEANAMAFYVENKSPAQAIQVINAELAAKQSRVRVISGMDERRVERFVNKPRGQA